MAEDPNPIVRPLLDDPDQQSAPSLESAQDLERLAELVVKKLLEELSNENDRTGR